MTATCVLFSGGLDSLVLLAAERRDRAPVLPVHVRAGFAWEDAERRTIDRLLAAPAFESGVEPLTTLTVDMREVYPSSHWAVAGTPPAYDTPDEDVYLVGRNLVLLSKTAVMCARKGIHRIALGPLAGNPFPDATPEFFQAAGRALSLGLNHDIRIDAPLSALHKHEVVRLGMELNVPLEWSLSCMNPGRNSDVDIHCGACSKCRERRDAFREAGVADPTRYAVDWTASGRS